MNNKSIFYWRFSGVDEHGKQVPNLVVPVNFYRSAFFALYWASIDLSKGCIAYLAEIPEGVAAQISPNTHIEAKYCKTLIQFDAQECVLRLGFSLVRRLLIQMNTVPCKPADRWSDEQLQNAVRLGWEYGSGKDVDISLGKMVTAFVVKELRNFSMNSANKQENIPLEIAETINILFKINDSADFAEGLYRASNLYNTIDILHGQWMRNSLTPAQWTDRGLSADSHLINRLKDAALKIEPSLRRKFGP